MHKLISAILICFLLIGLSGCSIEKSDGVNQNSNEKDHITNDNNLEKENGDEDKEIVDPSLHTHSFSQNCDDKQHYKECYCGEIVDIAEHTLEWVIDLQPTYTSCGYKHSECFICGYKTDENTVINVVIDAPGIDPTPINCKEFVNHDDLVAFYGENREKIKSNFLCIEAISDSEKGIYVVNDWMELIKYSFEYDEENEDGYLNPSIVASFDVYSVELGTDTDVTMDIPFHSFTLEFVSKGFDQKLTDIRLVFADYTESNSIWKRVVYIFEGEKAIGEVYLSYSLDISDEWFADYLKDYVFVLK